MSEQMTEQEQTWLDEVREALEDSDVALHLVYTFTHGRGVQVKIKSRKIGPILFPADGQDLGDLLMTIGHMLDEDQVDPEPIEEVVSRHPWRATCGEPF